MEHDKNKENIGERLKQGGGDKHICKLAKNIPAEGAGPPPLATPRLPYWLYISSNLNHSLSYNDLDSVFVACGDHNGYRNAIYLDHLDG